MGVGFGRQGAAGLKAGVAARKLVQNAVIVGGVNHDGDGGEVFGGASHHRRPADVDVLNRLFVGHIGPRDGLLERIQIDADQINGRDVFARNGAQMFGLIAARQKPAVNGGVQSFDAAIHHFGKAGHLGDIGHGQPGLAQGTGGAAGRENLKTQLDQTRRERGETVLVGNGKQSAFGHRYSNGSDIMSREEAFHR